MCGGRCLGFPVPDCLVTMMTCPLDSFGGGGKGLGLVKNGTNGKGHYFGLITVKIRMLTSLVRRSRGGDIGLCGDFSFTL